MKAIYFTAANITARSRKMLMSLTRTTGCHPVALRRAKPALLIVDMQEYFLNKDSHAFLPNAPPAVQNIRKLASRFSRAGLPIILTRHINNRGNAGMLGTWWNDLITEKNPYNQIIPELRHLKAKVIKKSQYDAFYRTRLESYLREKGVDTLIITGVMTHLCCETTARSAFVRGFNVYFVVDGTATQNIDLHYATLLNLAHGFAVLVLTDELIKYLSVRDA